MDRGGLIAGVLPKLIMPGDGPGGIIVTIIIGIVGAFVGGFVVQLLGGTGLTGFSIWSILVATLGAILLLASVSHLSTRRTSNDLRGGLLLSSELGTAPGSFCALGALYFFVERPDKKWRVLSQACVLAR